MIACGWTARDSTMPCLPLLYAERHAPQSAGFLTALTAANTTPATLIASFHHGLIKNLQLMLSQGCSEHERNSLCRRITRLVACGAAIRKNKLLQHYIKQVFSTGQATSLQVVFPEHEPDAALGAAALTFAPTS